jgi:hypothetical protein
LVLKQELLRRFKSYLGIGNLDGDLLDFLSEKRYIKQISAIELSVINLLPKGVKNPHISERLKENL